VARQLARARDRQADRAFQEWARAKDAEKQRAQAAQQLQQRAAQKAAHKAQLRARRKVGGTFKKWCAAADAGLYVSAKDGTQHARPPSLATAAAKRQAAPKPPPAWSFEPPSEDALGLFGELG
jgi:hypothetical protein